VAGHEAMSEFEVRAVEAEAVRPLRRALLRPHQQVEELVYPGTTIPTPSTSAPSVTGTWWASPRSFPGRCREGASATPGRCGAWRWSTGQRGYGLGGRLLAACIDHAGIHGGRLVWCNARAGSSGFYERYGFSRDGEPFQLADIGPHYRMYRAITPAGGRTLPGSP